jgi:hypothetical protein
MKALAAAVLIGAGVFESNGEVVWDSLGSADGANANFDVNLWRAAAFRVTGSSQVTLSSIAMDLAGTISGTVNVRLFADTAAKPGTPLGRISDIPLNAGASGAFEAPSDTVFTLDPGSVYWITVRMRPSTGSGAWGTQNSFVESPFQGSGVTFTSSLTSANGGTSWSAWGEIPALKLDIVPIPEPGSIWLAAVGTVSLGLLKWHRRRVL